ncbi:MAG TPA: cytochrome c oxidase subunit II [Pirellulales bacterium]|nr:cytochrome c oxidase subunit II [Pirellulales bacterium]
MSTQFFLLAETATGAASIFAPASPPAESIRALSILVLAITLGIFFVVEGVLLYCLVQFRKQKSAKEGTEPAQVYGSKSIEIAWTVAPALVVFTLVLVTTRTLWEVEMPVPEPKLDDNTLFVTVVGRQWWWEYQYQNYNGQSIGFVTANELHVPASDVRTPRRVYLTLKSADVCHSFWVPRLAGKTDLIPGRENSMWFQTDELGLFVGQCAEYCGTQHGGMLLRVFVDEPADFERWLEEQKRPAVSDSSVEEGRLAFLGQSCVNCHRVRGTPADGTYAPDLTHLMSRTTLASGLIENNEENLRRWIADPQNVKEGCLMPAFGLSDRERDLIVDYLLSLR